MLPALVIAAQVAAALPAASPAEVVAAERAFAADGAAHGIKASFLAHSSNDAIVFAPDPVNAHATYGAQPDLKPGESDGLAWWPLWAGIARSGDIGFTTGPVEIKGERTGFHYFTIWKKQADGTWKWSYDGGGGGDGKGEAPQGSPPTYLAPATAAAPSPDAAVAEVKALEAKLNAEAATDQKAAILRVMAPDGRIHAQGQPPAKDSAAFERVLATRPASFTYANVFAESSKAGDFVWTWGEAKWTRDGQPREGHYVRVWQDRKGGWKLVFDQLVPKPPKS